MGVGLPDLKYKDLEPIIVFLIRRKMCIMFNYPAPIYPEVTTASPGPPYKQVRL
jgi:hypothetical protein